MYDKRTKTVATPYLVDPQEQTSLVLVQEICEVNALH